MRIYLKHGFLAVVVTLCTVASSCGFHTDPEYTEQYINTIYLIRADGTGLRAIAPGSIAFPTDSLILFSKDYNNPIFAMKYDSTDFRTLYPSIRWEWISQSPHRDYFLITTRKSSIDYFQGNELYLLRADLSVLSKLNLPTATYGMASLSPNAQSILFRHGSILESIGIDGNGLIRIAPFPDSAAAYTGIFASDSVIIYSQYRRMILDVKYFNLSTQTHRLIARDMGRISHTGRQVVGSKLILTNYDTTRIIDINTSQILSHFLAEGASFSSDGTRVVACRGPNIFLFDLAGNTLTPIYSEKDVRNRISSPQFTNDDSQILFVVSVPIDP